MVSRLSRVFNTSYSTMTKLIATHNGKFHCDEALACYMLRRLPEYSSSSVIRTRDPKVIDTCDIVVDVGGVYDPLSHRYDHHQRSFSESMNSLTDNKKPWVTKLSSAGLVYLHFGRRVIQTITGGDLSDSTVEDLFDYIYAHLIEEVDGVDNGIESFGGTRRYIVSTALASRVNRLNAPWNSSDQNDDERFAKAMELTGEEFIEKITYYRDVLMPAMDIVRKGIEQRYNIDPSGEIIALDTPCPWSDHLFALEKCQDSKVNIKYVLYKEKESDKWRVQAVPVESGSFQSRLALHERWRGIRDEDLTKLTGIPGCVFVHSSGFIGANKTYDGALQMAQKTIELQKISQL